MDIQALTAVKIAEAHLARFDPDKEEAYYNAYGDWPWWVGAGRSMLRRYRGRRRQIGGRLISPMRPFGKVRS